MSKPLELYKNNEGYLVLGGMELPLIERYELDFEHGKGEGMAELRLVMPVTTSLMPAEQDLKRDQ